VRRSFESRRDEDIRDWRHSYTGDNHTQRSFINFNYECKFGCYNESKAEKCCDAKQICGNVWFVIRILFGTSTIVRHIHNAHDISEARFASVIK